MSIDLAPRDYSTLRERLQSALVVTPSLVADVIGESCRRFRVQGSASRANRVERLIELGAWTDAALGLIELELPQWQVRRLVYDSGEWHCALSRERELPEWLDESVDGRHADLALAILCALVEVQRQRPRSFLPGASAAGRKEPSFYEPLCCESFA